MHRTVAIARQEGYIFKGLIPETFAFVPKECVTFNGKNSPMIDNVSYVKSGWDVRNMRFNQTETSGSRLFPEVRDDLADLEDARVRSFIERMNVAYASL